MNFITLILEITHSFTYSKHKSLVTILLNLVSWVISVSYTHTEVSKSREKEKLQLVRSSFHPANQFKCCHNKGNSEFSEFKCGFWWLMVTVICRLTFLNWANELTHHINYKESNKHHPTHRTPQVQFKFCLLQYFIGLGFY